MSRTGSRKCDARIETKLVHDAIAYMGTLLRSVSSNHMHNGVNPHQQDPDNIALEQGFPVVLPSITHRRERAKGSIAQLRMDSSHLEEYGAVRGYELANTHT